MSEAKHSNQQQDNTIRQAVLVTQATAANTFLFIILGIYLAVTTGTWQAYAFSVIAILAEASVVFAALPLVRRGQVKSGGWVLLGAALLATALISFLYVSIGYVAVAYNLVVGFFFIRYVLPHESRRLAMGLVVIELAISIAIEIFNPGWREVSQLMLTISPILTTTLGAAFLVVLVRQAWRGNIRVKLVTSFTVIALISVAIVGTVIYFSYRNQVREDIRQRLLNMVSIAALQQDGDLHATLQKVGDEETDAYKEVKATNFAIVSTDSDIAYLYTMRMDEQGNIYFVVDTGPKGSETQPLLDIYPDAGTKLVENFITMDSPVAEDDFYTDEDGTFLSAYAPFYRKDGTREGIIGLDIAADKIVAQERAVLFLILGTTLSTMVLVTLLGLFLGNLFVGPIINLSAVAKKISEGDLSARATIETQDEIGKLAKDFNIMTSQLQETLQGLEQRVADRTKALTTSAEVSRRLSTILDLDQLVTEVVEQVKNSFNYYHAHIYLMDESGRELIMAGGTGEAGRTMLARGHKIQAGKGLVGLAAETSKLIRVSDTTQDPQWLPNPLLPETKSEIAVPIILGEKVLGVLDVQQNVQDGLSEEDARLLQAIAYQVAAAIRNAQVFTETQQQAERETLINEIGRKIQNTASVEQALQVAARELGQALGARDSRAIIDLQSSVITKAN